MKPHWLRDHIACSWWPNDGPVHMRPASKPFDETQTPVVVTFQTPSPGVVKQRILAILDRFPEQRFQSSALATRLYVDIRVAVGALMTLRDLGAVDLDVGGWRRVPRVESEAAE